MRKHPPNKDWIRKQVIDEIIFKPALSLLPAFIGLPLALAPWVFDAPNFLISSSGIAVSFLSIGIYATRVCLNWGNEAALREKILSKNARLTENTIRKKLIVTRQELVLDGDPSTQDMFDRLIALQETLKIETQRPRISLDQNEIISQVEDLIDASIDNLTESARLSKKASRSRISAVQQEILGQRHNLLDEADQSIKSIEKILLAFVSNQENHKQTDTARIRQELEAQLEISERVKLQMDSWHPTQTESKL